MQGKSVVAPNPPAGLVGQFSAGMESQLRRIQRVSNSPTWSPKSPTWSPNMMPTWLYRQDFAKFSLNSYYNFTCRNCGGGDRGRVAIYRPFGEVSLSLNRTVTCMVLKANDRRTSCPCHDEFRGPRSDYVRQVALATTTTKPYSITPVVRMVSGCIPEAGLECSSRVLLTRVSIAKFESGFVTEYDLIPFGCSLIPSSATPFQIEATQTCDLQTSAHYDHSQTVGRAKFTHVPTARATCNSRLHIVEPYYNGAWLDQRLPGQQANPAFTIALTQAVNQELWFGVPFSGQPNPFDCH
ncbi:uncharacterized protein TNCV_4470981 [Trichonephila clavipes]|uniref:Uncharacterized protein n=1 Tax=Trichonephila clavipes TaxID=2585209 RepID=A0A8X6SL82_TRICX|nr:uncharacterized protein TNCV_4470981 [Trichonephila clavipes]